MAYWLFKSEPEAFSWQQLKKLGAKGSQWDGVRNYQARNNMRAMEVVRHAAATIRAGNASTCAPKPPCRSR
jgi:predicted RNA-binding protein with PUA-like domain